MKKKLAAILSSANMVKFFERIGWEVKSSVSKGAEPYDTSDHEQDGYSFGSARRFRSMWFDHSMLPKKQRQQPWIVAYPKE